MLFTTFCDQCRAQQIWGRSPHKGPPSRNHGPSGFSRLNTETPRWGPGEASHRFTSKRCLPLLSQLNAEEGRFWVFMLWTYIQMRTCSLGVSFFFVLSEGHLKCSNHRTVCRQTCITDALHWQACLQSPQIPSPMPGRGLCQAPVPVILSDL